MVEGLTYIEDLPSLNFPAVSFALQFSRCTARSHASRGGAVVARRAHNPKVRGSNPFPATKHIVRKRTSEGPRVSEGPFCSQAAFNRRSL